MEVQNQVGIKENVVSGNYISGVSDRESEEFQRKSDNKVEAGERYRDSVEISSIRETPIPSENYEDYRKSFITKMPDDFFSYNNRGTKLQEAIRQLVQKYSRGEISDEVMKSAFIDACKGTNLTKMNAPRNQHIQDVYEYFQKANVRCMVDECFKAGSSIAKQNGGKESNNWVYYDSDYYKKSEHLRKMLQEAANEITSEKNIDCLDFEKIEKESKFTLDGGLNFNSAWDWRARERGVCSMVEDREPQEKFSFFYQSFKNKTFNAENPSDSQAGICIINFKNNEWAIDVPFNNSTALGKIEDRFNLRKLFFENVKFIEPDLLEQLEHFNVYSGFYNHNKVFMEE